MHKTIIVTNKVKQIMYSTQTPPFIRVVLRPPPVAEKGSIALSEITSIRKCIYAQRDTTIFQTGQPPPFPYQTIISNVFLVFKWAALRKNLFAGFTLQSFCVTIIWV